MRINRRHACFAFFVLVCLVTAGGCRQQEEPEPAPAVPVMLPRVDGLRALEEVTQLVQRGPRVAGTEGAQQAAVYLSGRLRDLGVETEIESFSETTPSGERTFHNVIARIPGRGEGLLILGSHYDTKSGIGDGFQGANDSGSSTGLLLELAGVFATAFRDRPPGPSIWLVFFDGEECAVRYGPHDGLHGSRHLAAQLAKNGRAEEVKGVIVLDMVGDRDLNITLPRNSSPELVSAVFQAAREEGVRHAFSLFKYEIGDDHEPFIDAGMPGVDIIDFQYGSRKGLNDYWHSEEDRLDKISAESLETVGNVVIRLVYNLGE